MRFLSYWVYLPVIALALAGCKRGSNQLEAATLEMPRDVAVESGFVGSVPLKLHLLVDQLGYRPNDAKVAVIRDPSIGFDSNNRFTPGSTYQVRAASNGEVVYSGSPKPWNRGAVQASSGDRGWWFDFSTVTAPGRYFIFDVEKKVRSPSFNIDEAVYRNTLKAAMRTYYYQRSGVAKQPPHAEACWADEVSYARKNQDTAARDVTDQKNTEKVRDLSGGWFDAGDTNKYVTFAVQPVHQLLTAYEQNPSAFTDDFNIPESGNGIPDVIDEVKWEIDWLKKMQYPDGSVALKVGAIENAQASPPSSDRSSRFYVPSCTSSTISAAGMFAHAALAYSRFEDLQAETDVLKGRAISAWSHYHRTADKQTDCDTGLVKAGDADRNAQEQESLAVVAAIYLFALTGDTHYQTYVKEHYRVTRPYRDMGWSRYDPEQGDALLFFTKISNADKTLSASILGDKRQDIHSGNKVYGFEAQDDLYRAYLHDEQYHWGSNNPRANYGNTNLDTLHFDLGVKDASLYSERALGILHYFHGVNPLGMAYLSNMYSLGVTNAANEIYHTWFAAGTKWGNALTSACGPAPGYVPGGPNFQAAENGVPLTLSPPTGQPRQKAYKDWNASWPDSSWAISEPAIYYQSAYIKLLAAYSK